MRLSHCRILLVALLPAACESAAPTATTIEIDARWSPGVPLPVALSGVAAAEFGGTIIVAGGDSETGPSQRVYRFAPGASSWERLGDLPDVRVSARLVVSDGTLYLIGGMHLVGDNVYFRDRSVYVRDPTSDHWSERAPFPDLRDGDAVSVPGGIVVVGGGFGSPEHGGAFPGDSVVVYNAADDRWYYAAPIRMPRHNPMVVAIDANVHVFGGQPLEGLGTILDIEIYDAHYDTWSAGGQFADYGRITAQAYARVGSHVHFLGGTVAAPGSPSVESHLRYNIATQQWDVMPQLPTPRGHAAAVVVDGRIWVIGGLRGPRFLPGAFTNAVEIFDAR